ncbi:MAG: hypothetical protein ABIR32_06155 [Ilumatobacteraceae bacterium]
MTHDPAQRSSRSRAHEQSVAVATGSVETGDQAFIDALDDE